MKSNGEGLKKFHSWWRRLGDRAEGRELGTLELGAHGCGKSFLAHTTTITNLKYNEHHKESVFLSAGSTGGDMQCSGDEAAQRQCCVQPFHFVSPPAPASQEGGSAPATDIKSTIFYCQKQSAKIKSSCSKVVCSSTFCWQLSVETSGRIGTNPTCYFGFGKRRQIRPDPDPQHCVAEKFSLSYICIKGWY